MKLSEHFTLEELTFSEMARRLGVDNSPDDGQLSNLRQVASLMETIRHLVEDFPIVVHSGFRTAVVNRAIGGVATSAHCLGLACDFTCPSFGKPEVVAAKIVEAEIQYDQLILEYGWVHVGLSPEGGRLRNESLTKASAKSAYGIGIRF